MSGGKAAQWNDTELTDTFTREVVAFMERNQSNPFFLYYAPHNVHAPTIPNPRFAGSSGLGNRADTLVELDWSIGELMKTLDRLKLTDNTLVIFSSDNGWDSWTKKDKAAPVKAGLFDLEADQAETENLVGEKPEIAKRLKGLLKTAQAATSTRPR